MTLTMVVRVGCVSCFFLSMCLSMFSLGFFVFLQGSKSIAWVFIAYFMGGMAIGSFEGNLLSCITPLGHATKIWAIVGFPSGFAAISIVGFGLLAVNVQPVVIYLAVFLFCVAAMVVFFWTIPTVTIQVPPRRACWCFHIRNAKRESALPGCDCLVLNVVSAL
jgi:hypothetical protein